MAGVFKSLNLSDIRITPFRAYKKWSGGDRVAYTLYEGINIGQLKDLGATYPYIQDSDYSYDYVNLTYTDKLKGSVYHSIDHLFYRQIYDNPKAVFGSGNYNYQDRFIYGFVNVLSINQQNVGEGIQPGSVKLQMLNSGSRLENTGSFRLVDDLSGNLVIDSDIDATGSLTKFYRWDSTGYTLPSQSAKIQSSEHVYRLQGERANNTLNKLINSASYFSAKYSWNSTTDAYYITPSTSSRGVCWYFSGQPSSSAIIKPESPEINTLYNFINIDYSIGFYVKINTPQQDRVLIEKRNVQEILGIDLNGNVLTNTITRYPYKLTTTLVSSSFSSIIFEKSDGYNTIKAEVQPLSSSIWYYVWLNRSGSEYQLSAREVNDYENHPYGSLHKSSSVTDYLQDYECSNNSYIYVGGNHAWSGSFDGYIESLSMFSAGYRDKSPQYNFQLLSGGTNTLNVGNVFYKQGIITITNPAFYDKDTPFVGIKPDNLQYRSTQTIYETEIGCKIGAGEFNFSNNPTLHVYDPRNNQFKLKGFATSSDFKPYITQIGLYDDRGNLLVVGKPSQPIKVPTNVDTTFIVKFDR